MNRTWTRREFISVAAGVSGAPCLAQRRTPNIVFIAADDLGYADLGVQGCSDIPTPFIDSIARNGIRFTDAYVSCPVCSPTRAGWITGRYQQRFGHEFNTGPEQEAGPEVGLPLDQITLADRLKKLGYVTGVIGKWHLGFAPKFHPLKRGFDEFFGFLAGAHPYLPDGGRPSRIMRGTQRVEESEYLTDAFGREATAFIDRHRHSPFFLYLPFNAVHNPLQATEKYLARFGSLGDAKRRTYAAMLSAMDDAVGRVLAKLREHKLEENTLVFFISDNGGPTLATTSRNSPLRGYKGQVLEGGIRVPFLMQWKGRLPAGKVYREPVMALDILPTAVAAGGGGLSTGEVDGVDLIPFLAEARSGSPHESLYWRFGPQTAIRQGEWKAVRLRDGDWELYNLAEDAGEARDLASANPDRLKRLREEWEQWNRQLMPPRWIRRSRQAGRPRRQRLRAEGQRRR